MRGNIFPNELRQHKNPIWLIPYHHVNDLKIYCYGDIKYYFSTPAARQTHLLAYLISRMCMLQPHVSQPAAYTAKMD